MAKVLDLTSFQCETVSRAALRWFELCSEWSECVIIEVFFRIITSLAGALSKKHYQKQEEVSNQTEWLIPDGIVPQSEPTQCVVVLRETRYSQKKGQETD